MAQSSPKGVNMKLYSAAKSPEGHWIRIILAEKKVNANVVYVNPAQPPPVLKQINPFVLLPTLTDNRDDLVLYNTPIIAEYLEERFPHPPLLPVYPILRAKNRQMIYRIEQDWYPLLQHIEAGTQPAAQSLLQNSLKGLEKLFAAKPYFLSDEFSLVDCCIAPLLWRLKQLNITITASAIEAYQARIFSRPAFKISLEEIQGCKGFF
jgi:stringent starvation protein A